MSETQGFKPGNRFWEARSSAGPKPTFETAEQLRVSCLEYFEWVEANPLWERKVFHTNGMLTEADIPKMRAMTLIGLCNFLDIHEQTWRDWRKSRADLSGVMTAVEAGIRQQKFEGAAADMLNANIIARDLGLADKAEHSGPNGTPVQVTIMRFSGGDSPTE